MKGIDFLYRINEIGDDLIENASETALSRRKHLSPQLFAAACICAAVAAIVLYLGLSTQREELRKTVGLSEETQTEPIIHDIEMQEETQAEPNIHDIDIQEETSITKGPELIVSDNRIMIPDNTETDYYPDETIYDIPDQNPLTDINLPASDVMDETENIETDYSEPVTEETDSLQPSYRVMDIMWAQNEEMRPASVSEDSEDRILFWQDGVYNYYIDAQILGTISVLYEDGSLESVSEALSNGHIGINDLSIYGVPYYAE